MNTHLGAITSPHKLFVLFVGAIVLLALSPRHSLAEDPQVLRIGSSETSAINSGGVKEDEAIKTLQGFIKDQTGFENKILRYKTWTKLTDKFISGEIQLADYQGYEYAWAKHRDPKITPIAIAVNGPTYIRVCLVVQDHNPAKNIAAFQGQTLSLPHVMQGTLRLVVDKLCRESHKPLDSFFGKVSTPNNTEDAVDDVVEGIVQIAAVDRFSLDAYKRRKPGRFAKVRVLVTSQPLPPPLIAFYPGNLSRAAVQKVESGLLKANGSERGDQLLRMFKLTGFNSVPADFNQVIEATYKNYPPPPEENASAAGK